MKSAATCVSARRTRFEARHPLLAAILVGFLAASTGGALSADLDLLISSDGRMKLFARAIARSGVSEILKRPGPYVVFIPTDKALNDEGSAFLLDRVLLTESNAERLIDLVRHHVAEAPDPALRLDRDMELQTLADAPLAVTRVGTGTIVGHRAAVTDRLEAENGVAYLVDRLLWPRESRWPSRASPPR